MTAADPNLIDTEAWLRRTRKKLARPAGPRAYTTLDFKLAWVLRQALTRDELLAILDLATNKRFDNRAGIETFLTMMAGHIDGMDGR